MLRKWRCDGCGDIREDIFNGDDRQCQECGETYYLTDDSDLFYNELPLSEQ